MECLWISITLVCLSVRQGSTFCFHPRGSLTASFSEEYVAESTWDHEHTEEQLSLKKKYATAHFAADFFAIVGIDTRVLEP